MFRNTAQKVTLFKPTNPLPFVKGAIAIPSRSVSINIGVAHYTATNCLCGC